METRQDPISQRPAASASQLLGLKVCTATPGLSLLSVAPLQRHVPGGDRRAVVLPLGLFGSFSTSSDPLDGVVMVFSSPTFCILL